MKNPLRFILIAIFTLHAFSSHGQVEEIQKFNRLKYDIVGPGNNTGGALTLQYWNNDYNEFEHQIGLNAGLTTGMGVSYRYWPGRFGNQITFLPFKNRDFYMVSLGYTGLIKIHEIRQLALFGYVSDHMLFMKTKNVMNLGIGVGFEVYFGVIGVNIMYGYGIYNIMNKSQVNLTAEMGLFYRF